MELTDREKKMLDLLTEGATSAAIAEKVGLTDGTTRVYLHKLYRRLKVANRTAAACWWLQQPKSE